ncbi:MAG: ROK family protein [Bryobacteraceae bacterium]
MRTAIGIDIGGTTVKCGLVDEFGVIRAHWEQPSPSSVDTFAHLLRGVVAKWPDAGGVGFGCKGIVDPLTTEVVRSPGPVVFLEGTRLAALAGWDKPARGDNDARAAMAGEVLWGSAKGRKDALMFTLGTGVGGAILANGRIVRGAEGIAGHLGHVTVEADGVECICGNRGCIETVFSAKAIESAATRAVHAGCDTELAAAEVTCEAVFLAASHQDRVARGIVDRAVRRLGAAMAGLLFAFDPEVVIVGGRIAAAGEPLLGPLRAEIHERTRRFLGREVPLVPPAVSDGTGVAGAAALVLAADGSGTV